MSDEPPLSSRELLAWLQATGLLFVVVQVVRSPDPLSFKLLILGVPLLGLYTLWIYRLGRHREREVTRQARRERLRGRAGARQPQRDRAEQRDAA